MIHGFDFADGLLVGALGVAFVVLIGAGIKDHIEYRRRLQGIWERSVMDRLAALESKVRK